MAYGKINFSRTVLVNIPAAAEGKRDYYRDAKEPGLLICVTSTGIKSFQVYLKQDGSPARVTLGHFSASLADSVEIPRDCSHSTFLSNNPELNVRMARALAALVKIDLKAGVRPADVKRAKRDELTLGELFDEYVNRHLIPEKKKRIQETKDNFARYLGEVIPTPQRYGPPRSKTPGSVNWQNRKLSTISKGQVQKLKTDLAGQSSRHCANRAVEMLRAMFNKAIQWELFNKSNPAAGVELYSCPSRGRFLQADELQRIFESFAEEENQDIRDYMLLAFTTGARKGNLTAMRWADVHLDRAQWLIPSKVSKNNERMVIPLVSEAVAILRNRKPVGKAEFVFPGHGKSGHLQDVKSAWKRILDRDELKQLAKRIRHSGAAFKYPLQKVKGQRDHTSNLETMGESLERAREIALEINIDTDGARVNDTRVHDIRRTLGSWQAAAGASLHIIGKSLGHKDVESTAIYARLNIDPVRDSMQVATHAMFVAGGLLPKAEVIQIEGAKKKRVT